MSEWIDSEAEDSPHANGIGNTFSTSPNHGSNMRRKGSTQKMQQTRKASHGSARIEKGINGSIRVPHAASHRSQRPPIEKGTNASVRVPHAASQQTQRPPPIEKGTNASVRVPHADSQQSQPPPPPPPKYTEIPVRMVPEIPEMRLIHAGQQSKRMLIRRIQQDSMKMLTMSCQAVMVRGASGNYNVYHLEITSDFYKQKWVVCKRFSEFYRLRKRLLARILAHKKQGNGCTNCGTVHAQLKAFGFPNRVELFSDQSALVEKRTQGLEAFIVALCQYISDDSEFQVCPEINASRFMVKEFLQFPLEHECQHVRAVRQLKYVDPRDVQVDTDSCPICLSEWRELDGNQLTLSPCGHFFHENCINEWYRTRFDCPMCRTIAGQEE